MRKRIDVRNVIGKKASACTGIISVEVGWLLRTVVVVEQAAERGLADFVALAEQTIAVTTITQTDYLQQQDRERDGG